MKTLLLAAAAAFVFGGVAIQHAQAHTSSLPLFSSVVINGGSQSVGGGKSGSGGASTSSSGTTFGGTATNGAKTSNFETSGPSHSDGNKIASFSSGSVTGSTTQASSTNGPAKSGSSSASVVTVCAGVACSVQ